MIKKTILIFVFIVLGNINAQNVEVIETKLVQLEKDKEAFYPRFANNDDNILYTSSNYIGLFSYNLVSGTSKTITEKKGAGYNPIILSDNVIYRSFVIETGKKNHSISSANIISGEKEVLVSNKRHLKLPSQLYNEEILFIEKSKPLYKEINSITLKKSNLPNKAVYVENDNLLLVDETVNTINPLGKGIYVWESISRDGSKLLFTFENKGAFITDLEGNIITNIKDAHYPRFSPNGKFISYMVDIDDRYNYISSDIYVYSIDLEQSFKITNTNDKIEMYAEWSNSGDKLIYHTTEGELYISTLLTEN